MILTDDTTVVVLIHTRTPSFYKCCADDRDAALDFAYIAVSDVMNGPTAADMDWDSVLEVALNAAAAVHRHLVVRFFLEYPGKETGVPEYLRKSL